MACDAFLGNQDPQLEPMILGSEDAGGQKSLFAHLILK